MGKDSADDCSFLVSGKVIILQDRKEELVAVQLPDQFRVAAGAGVTVVNLSIVRRRTGNIVFVIALPVHIVFRLNRHMLIEEFYRQGSGEWRERFQMVRCIIR